MWLVRLLNRLGLRKDMIVCIRQEDTFCWSDHLGKKTEGKCEKCGSPIFFEKKNKPFRKVCNRCAMPQIWQGRTRVKIQLTHSFLVGPGDYCLPKGTILDARELNLDDSGWVEFAYRDIWWLLSPNQYTKVDDGHENQL